MSKDTSGPVPTEPGWWWAETAERPGCEEIVDVSVGADGKIDVDLVGDDRGGHVVRWIAPVPTREQIAALVAAGDDLDHLLEEAAPYNIDTDENSEANAAGFAWERASSFFRVDEPQEAT